MHLDYYECLYRKSQTGEFIYPNLDDIYHLNIEYDSELMERLFNNLLLILPSYDYVLAPLGIGNHADHLLIHRVMKRIAKENICKVFFYEEIPYICYMYKVNKVIKPAEMKPIIIKVTARQWKLKCQAILCYRSQLHILWKDEYERINQLSDVSSIYNYNHALRIWKMEEDGR